MILLSADLWTQLGYSLLIVDMVEHYIDTDKFGEISVSSDGNRIAIGEMGKSSEPGVVIVYEYDSGMTDGIH